MKARGTRLATAVALTGITLLAGCEPTGFAPTPTGPAVATNAAVVAPPPGPRPEGPSATSLALKTYYTRVQSDLRSRGLLRTETKATDAVFTDTMLIRDFERIALAEEYERGAGLTPSKGGASAIKKWTQPIRMSVEFGPNVPLAQTTDDRTSVARYAKRLNQITGHPITLSDTNPNFTVMFMSEDDRDLIIPRIQELVPDVDTRALRIFKSLPRSIHCVVMAFSSTPGGYDYGQAIAIIRAEHPPLLRQSCVHEEVAQGLGLANDHPRARPSIFNDDDEFALLTQHDEMLLKILYDPRLTPGMTVEQARPIVVEKAGQLMGTTRGPI